MHNIEEKQGYKFTEEFGYIPEDWDIVPLGDFISTEKYAIVDGPFGSNLKTEHYRKKGIPIIQSGFVTSNKFIADSYLYVDEEKFQQEIRSKVIPGDIVMAKIGANCGTCAILPNNHPEGILAGNSLKITVRENCNKFLMYLFHRLLPLNKMEEAISRTAQPALSCGRLKILPIIKPPLPEQEKIAEVLSDIDELIESTQKLIDKKKDLKTATMQKLLTPKPHWVAKKLGEIVKLQGGYSFSSTNFKNVGIPIVRISNIYNNLVILEDDIVYHDEIDLSSCFIINKNDILIAMSGATTGKIGLYCYDNIAYLNQRVGKFIIIDETITNKLFLLQLLKDWKFETLLKKEIAQGAQPNVSSAQIEKMEFMVPISYTEQQKIAQTLSDMDAEIEALEKELNKYKGLKTGMMQELLTGKIRLKQENNNTVSFKSNKSKHKANDEFKDAVIISMLAYKFGSNQYPLGAFRRQKLSYLFKRHNNLPIDEYLKKAMGPYNPQMKYSGGEGIAIRNKYVKEVKQRGLIASSEIAKAKTYFDKYYSEDSLLWLEQNFRYKSNNELEVLATIDYTILDLKAQNKEITLANIKEYINNNAEWKPKLEKPFFTDSAIIKAIQESKNLLNSH